MAPKNRFYRTPHMFIMAFMGNVTKTSATAVTGQQVGSRGHRSGKPYAGVSGDQLASQVYANMRSIARMIYTITNPRRKLTEWTVRQFVAHTIHRMHRGLPNATKLKELRTHETARRYGCTAAQVPGQWEAFLLELQRRVHAEDPRTLSAWVEYELRFRIHPLADGSGRLATALSAWIMCRAGRAIPNYAYLLRDDLHAKLREGYEAFSAHYDKVCFGDPEEIARSGPNPPEAAVA